MPTHLNAFAQGSVVVSSPNSTQAGVRSRPHHRLGYDRERRRRLKYTSATLGERRLAALIQIPPRRWGEIHIEFANRPAQRSKAQRTQYEF
jgi:hypothetical protein